MIAERWPSAGCPMNSQSFFPMADGLMAFSTKVVVDPDERVVLVGDETSQRFSRYEQALPAAIAAARFDKPFTTERSQSDVERLTLPAAEDLFLEPSQLRLKRRHALHQQRLFGTFLLGRHHA